LENIVVWIDEPNRLALPREVFLIVGWDFLRVEKHACFLGPTTPLRPLSLVVNRGCGDRAALDSRYGPYDVQHSLICDGHTSAHYRVCRKVLPLITIMGPCLPIRYARGFLFEHQYRIYQC